MRSSKFLWIEIWSMAIKLSGPRAFRPVVTVVAVVIALFFVAIIIATWSGGRGGRCGLVVGARRSGSEHGRRGLVVEVVSGEPLGTWSTWSVVDVARRGSLSGLLGLTWLTRWLGMARLWLRPLAVGVIVFGSMMMDTRK